VAQQLHDKQVLPWFDFTNQQEVLINLTPPFRRCTIHELVEQATGVDFHTVTSLETAFEIAQLHGLELDPQRVQSIGRVLMELFGELVEPTLIQPTFVLDYPAEECPLTKRHRQYPALAERFELFINGFEFANAYTELTDPREQAKHFAAQEERRRQGDDEAHLPDSDFVMALRHAMPPTGGLGIGLDRLMMLLTNARHIKDVIFFPLR
jgi:lysyl-tRNA synthetase, class II